MSMTLAALEVALRQERELDQLAPSYVHRAVREDSLGFLIGREAILADWVATKTCPIRIEADLGDVVSFRVVDGKTIWAGHRWVQRIDGAIVHETLIEDCGTTRAPKPVHPPLGELRAGRGQYDAGALAILPEGFPSGAIAVANHLHRAWNGRAVNLYPADWFAAILKVLPDATFYFERALQAGPKTALLWRVHGHSANGQRVRLIGSSIVEFDGNQITHNDSVIDQAALTAQLDRPLIMYR
jgi:SnoaL-like polyketide cyclase